MRSPEEVTAFESALAELAENPKNNDALKMREKYYLPFRPLPCLSDNY